MSAVILNIDEYDMVSGTRSIVMADSYSDVSINDIIKVYNITRNILYYDTTIITTELGITSVQNGIITIDHHFPELRNTDELYINLYIPISNEVQLALDSKEDAFVKNTAFNKNFGSVSDTVLEGRTFGTAANNNTEDFEVPLTFSTGLNRVGNTISTIGVAYSNEIFTDYTESPMIISGGEISEGTNVETFKVDALSALLRETNSETGKLVYVTKAEEDNIAVTAVDVVYFICLNYNSGSPTISLGSSNPYLTDKRSIPIGKVMKDSSSTIHYIYGGYNFQDGVEKLHMRAITLRKFELNGGSSIAYSGTNNFTMESGIIYGGINRISVPSYNSATTTFTPIYQNSLGGWIEGAIRNTIDYEYYDDGSGTLATVGNNKYGCHWIYRHIGDNNIYVLYGRDSYTLAEAEATREPTHPSHLKDFGCLIGRIITPQSGGSFAAVDMDTDKFFGGTAIADHANLTNLDYANSGHTGFAPTIHNHNGTYEPVFNKNTAFNKNFGDNYDEVARGNHDHDIGDVTLIFENNLI